MSVRFAARKTALVFAVTALVLLGIGLYFHWWDRYVERGLATWAVGELARRTDSTYHLALGDLTFLPFSGTISFDSATVVTDTVRSLQRPTPLPVLQVRAHQCEVTGINVPGLLLRRSFDARLLGCHRVVASIGLPPSVKGDHGARVDTVGITAPTTPPARPLGVSLFRIEEVSFPALSFTLRRPGRNGGMSAVLDQARLTVAELVFDATADPRTRHTVSAERARIEATGLVLRPGRQSAITIARLDAGITDSTLGLAGARHEPSMTDDQWVRHQRVRHDRVRFAFDSLEAHGVAYGSLVATGDFLIRSIWLRGARLDVLTDKRIAPGPPQRHRTPQAVAAAVNPVFSVDTVRITGSTIVYHERNPERERAGRLSFDGVRGRILDLSLPSRGQPLRINVSARFMDAGTLSVHATVPLDARDFRFDLAGKLGPMPAVALNAFVAENEPVRLANGQVDSVEFRVAAVRGRATTILTPYYRGLSVEAVNLGGGVIASVKRAILKLAAKIKVRSDNSADPKKRFRTSQTERVYDPANSWIQFIWFGLRDGLKLLIVK